MNTGKERKIQTKAMEKAQRVHEHTLAALKQEKSQIQAGIDIRETSGLV